MTFTVNKKLTVLAGRYELVREIGRGEFGVVYEARDILLGRSRVALKMFRASVASDERAAAGFGREVLAMTRVNHPNVVRFFDIVQDDEQIGYSMEHVPGVSLAALIERGPRLTLEETRAVLIQICRGAEAIHAQQVVHRDLKPENVVIDHTGRCKIVDFGVADLLGIRTQLFKGDRHRSCLAGTLDYMSPELLQDAEPGEGSDVYAIGVIGYLLITGQVPFAEFPLEASLRKKLIEEPPPPAAMESSCPDDLSSVISTAVARDRGERYPAPRALRGALERLDLEGEENAFPPTTCLGMRVNAFHVQTTWSIEGHSEEFGSRPHSRGQGVVFLLGVLTFVLIAVVAVVVAPRRSPASLWRPGWAGGGARIEVAVRKRWVPG